jgi:hypothetical protein
VLHSQVGIGTVQPNLSSQLEVVADDRGVLLPQVSLTSSTDTQAITNGNVESLLVYNTSTVADIIPGYYYWDGSKWNRLGAGGSSEKEEIIVIATNDGQNQFQSPLPVVDPNKVDVYRNGVKIGFTKLNLTTIEVEQDAICYKGDEIRIVQFN